MAIAFIDIYGNYLLSCIKWPFFPTHFEQVTPDIHTSQKLLEWQVSILMYTDTLLANEDTMDTLYMINSEHCTCVVPRGRSKMKQVQNVSFRIGVKVL